jgi:hypothetical protein
VDYDGEESDDLPGVTAVEAIKVDLKKVAVAFQMQQSRYLTWCMGKNSLFCMAKRGPVSGVAHVPFFRTSPFLSDGGLSQPNDIDNAPSYYRPRGQVYKHV